MNELIESLFDGFEVNGVEIPVSFLVNEDHNGAYVTYQQVDADSSLSGDDGLIGYVDYYDFDVYVYKRGRLGGNYTAIVDKIMSILVQHDFVWQPERTSEDMYEEDTGYYHKTLNFAILREVE